MGGSLFKYQTRVPSLFGRAKLWTLLGVKELAGETLHDEEKDNDIGEQIVKHDDEWLNLVALLTLHVDQSEHPLLNSTAHWSLLFISQFPIVHIFDPTIDPIYILLSLAFLNSFLP